MKYWCMEAKIVFCIFLGPEKGSRYYVYLLRTISIIGQYLFLYRFSQYLHV